jgi:hypothetical protein
VTEVVFDPHFQRQATSGLATRRFRDKALFGNRLATTWRNRRANPRTVSDPKAIPQEKIIGGSGEQMAGSAKSASGSGSDGTASPQPWLDVARMQRHRNGIRAARSASQTRERA